MRTLMAFVRLLIKINDLQAVFKKGFKTDFGEEYIV